MGSEMCIRDSGGSLLFAISLLERALKDLTVHDIDVILYANQFRENTDGKDKQFDHQRQGRENIDARASISSTSESISLIPKHFL